MTIAFGAPSNPTTTTNANYAGAIKPTHQSVMTVMIGTEGSIKILRMEVQPLHGDQMHVILPRSHEQFFFFFFFFGSGKSGYRFGS